MEWIVGSASGASVVDDCVVRFWAELEPVERDGFSLARGLPPDKGRAHVLSTSAEIGEAEFGPRPLSWGFSAPRQFATAPCKRRNSMRDRMPSEKSTANTSRSRGGVDISAQTWRPDRWRTGDWSARGTNPLTTSRTDRWSADPNRSSRRSPDSERRSRCCRKFGLLDAAPYRCPATTSSSNNWRLRHSPVHFWNRLRRFGKVIPFEGRVSQGRR